MRDIGLLSIHVEYLDSCSRDAHLGREEQHDCGELPRITRHGQDLRELREDFRKTKSAKGEATAPYRQRIERFNAPPALRYVASECKQRGEGLGREGWGERMKSCISWSCRLIAVRYSYEWRRW